MKISCEIIKDLLPLYHDNVCSEESRVLIEEHLTDCCDCRVELNKYEQDVNCQTLMRNEAKPLQTIAKVWKKDRVKAFRKGAAIVGGIALLFILSLIGLTQWKFIPVSSELIEVKNFCRLADGTIVYRYDINDDKDLRYIRFKRYEDGSYYVTPYRSIIEGKRRTEDGIFRGYMGMETMTDGKSLYIRGDGEKITSYYIGSKRDAILLWKEGMDIPPASEEFEAIFSND